MILTARKDDDLRGITREKEADDDRSSDVDLGLGVECDGVRGGSVSDAA